MSSSHYYMKDKWKIYNVPGIVPNEATNIFKKSPKDRLKTPIEKINKVIEMYKENPSIRVDEVVKKVGISSRALTNIRKIYGLDRLGYYYIIGNNPQGKNQYSTKP